MRIYSINIIVYVCFLSWFLRRSFFEGVFLEGRFFLKRMFSDLLIF